MLYDNSLFYIEKINPRSTKKACLPLRVYLSPFLFYEEQGQRRKEKSDGGDEPALSARTSRDSVPTAPSRADLAPPSTPQVAVCPGWIKLSHPAICPNTKRVSCKHLLLTSSKFRYRRAVVQESAKNQGAKYFAPLNSYFGKM